jgi:hypothetical protein
MILSNIGGNTKKHFLYYGLYSLLFVFVHLGLVSVFSFFHFLLDHDMNTIEEWLTLNGWEILIAAKAISFASLLYILKMNNYKSISIKILLDEMEVRPDLKMIGVISFIVIIFSSFVSLFGGEINRNEIEAMYVITSFIGSALFFIIDFGMIFLLEYFFEPKPRSFKLRLISLLLMFMISIKITQPFSESVDLVLVLHFVALYYFCRQKHLANGVLYAFFVVSPLACLFGLDLVWSNTHAIIMFTKEIPTIGIIGIWIIALSYFHRSRMN